MRLRSYLLTFITSLVLVVSLAGSAFAATGFDPTNPKSWAIIDYRAKQVVPKYKPLDTVSQKRISDLKTPLHSLVTLSYTTEDTSYSEKISSLANAQVASMDVVNKALDQANKRSGLKKFFLGPDYQNLKTVKTEVAASTARTEVVKNMSTRINSIPGRIVLRQVCTSFQKYDTSLKNQLKKSESGFSLLGWLVRLVKKY